MKRTVTICGFTQISGKSKKDGRPYSFTEISCLYDDERYRDGQGQRAVTFLVSNEALEDVTLAIGNVIHVPYRPFYSLP